MPSSDSFLRQLSSKEGWKSASKRWGGGGGGGWKQVEGLCGGENGMFVMKKRVMVVVDQSSHSKHAMMWALTHVTNKGDILTLLHIVSHSTKNSDNYSSSSSHYLATSLGSLCKACKPEVEVEALVIQGPKMATVMSQVKKLEVSVLVLGQKKPSPLLNCLCFKSSTEEFVEQCINNLECLTIGVRKQSKAVGGYLISTRWHKNFWLLA
ncbi:Adenine nucleotide alpha hydrolases-like superfamily protein [Perilla frutescens var. frutescens]|nr:Adenine nucleotide alpha hydrolases-like superfamily protein [Perilla frutescens var. frutescens]